MNAKDMSGMSQQQIIDAIAALTKVVEANKSFFLGSERTLMAANEKIRELIELIDPNKP